MKVNFNKSFADCFGKELSEKKNVAEQLGMYLFNLSHLGGSPLSGEQKYMAYSLCRRICSNPDVVEMSTEEASFLKEVCAEVFSSGAYGQIVDIIECNR